MLKKVRIYNVHNIYILHARMHTVVLSGSLIQSAAAQAKLCTLSSCNRETKVVNHGFGKNKFEKLTHTHTHTMEFIEIFFPCECLFI